MIVYSILLVTLCIAVLSIILLYKGANRKIKNGWQLLLLGISMAIFMYLYGVWIYLSYYVRYVFLISCILSLAIGWYSSKTNKSSSAFSIITSLLFSFFFIVCSLLYFTGTTGTPKYISLDFPLKTGRYFVLQGGKGLPANVFHYSYRGAVYAVDIIKLDDFGRRANSTFSSRLNDYYIFNDTIFSPCDGVIERARDENPDNIPPSRERGPSNTNQVLIRNDSFYVFMAHLRYKGVFVTEGQTVEKGQPLALVGNSGFTLEPHLHIQAHVNSHTGTSWYHEKPLFINFDDKTYLLFQVIKPKHINMQTK